MKKRVKDNRLRQSMKIHSISNNYYNANGNPRNGFRMTTDFETINQNMLKGGRLMQTLEPLQQMSVTNGLVTGRTNQNTYRKSSEP